MHRTYICFLKLAQIIFNNSKYIHQWIAQILNDEKTFDENAERSNILKLQAKQEGIMQITIVKKSTMTKTIPMTK